MDVTAITPQRLLQKAGSVQDVLKAMPQARSLCGTELCLAIRQRAEDLKRPQGDVLRPQPDATLENPSDATFKTEKTTTEREALKCAAFLLSVFRNHPTLRTVCAEQLPAALLDLWTEAGSEVTSTASRHTPSAPLTDTDSTAHTSVRAAAETAAETVAQPTSCSSGSFTPSRASAENALEIPAETERYTAELATASPYGSDNDGAQKATTVEQTENEKAFPLKPLFPKEKEKKENSLSSTLPAGEPEAVRREERAFGSFQEYAPPVFPSAPAVVDEEPTLTEAAAEDFTDEEPPVDEAATNTSEAKASKAKRRKKERRKENYMEWTEDNFCLTAQQHRGLLPDEEYELFVAYWTERNTNGKMRFQFCKTFSFERRMRTWMSKSKQIKREEERRLTARYGLPATTTTAPPPTEDEVVTYATARGIDADEARTFFYYYQAHSWKMRGQAIDDWKAALALWMQRKSTRRRTENKNTNTNPNRNGQENSQRSFERTSKAEANAEVDDFAKRLINNERNKNTNPDDDFLSLMGDGDDPVFA